MQKSEMGSYSEINFFFQFMHLQKILLSGKPLPSPEPEVLKDEKSNTFPQTNKSATLPARMSPRIMAKRAFSAFRFGHSPQLPDKSQPVNSPQLQDKSPSHSINSRCRLGFILQLSFWYFQ